MTQTHSFTNDLPGKWRLLGQMEISPGAGPAGSVADRIGAWLVEALRPLDLNSRLLEKILTSAQAAAEDTASGRVHMLIYTPEDGPSGSKSWGFFRVEKRSDPRAAEPIHGIVFYLYREGS